MFGSLLYSSSPPRRKMTRSSSLRLSFTCLSELAVIEGLTRRDSPTSFLLWDQQFKVVAGFCVFWVNYSLIPPHSDQFIMSAPKNRKGFAAGCIFLSLHHGPALAPTCHGGPN